MRSLALLVALLFVPTTGAEPSDAPDGIAMTVIRIDSAAVVVTWTAAPGAIAYQLYRGTSLDDLEIIAYTPQLQFTDRDAPDADTWYVVVSHLPPTTTDVEFGSMRGKCLSARGLSGVSITLAHCIPMRWP